MAGRKKQRAGSDASKKGGSVPAVQKIKGAAQMAAGAALITAGISMCILPGPGVAAIAGGAALASRGQRNFSGRKASGIEERLDAAAHKMGAAAKEQAGRAARCRPRGAGRRAQGVHGSRARYRYGYQGSGYVYGKRRQNCTKSREEVIQCDPSSGSFGRSRRFACSRGCAKHGGASQRITAR